MSMFIVSFARLQALKKISINKINSKEMYKAVRRKILLSKFLD